MIIRSNGLTISNRLLAFRELNQKTMNMVIDETLWSLRKPFLKNQFINLYGRMAYISRLKRMSGKY